MGNNMAVSEDRLRALLAEAGKADLRLASAVVRRHIQVKEN